MASENTSAPPEERNLELFYRTMSTEQLDDYRTRLRVDRQKAEDRAERQPSRGAEQQTIHDYCARRLVIIDRVLQQRGYRYRIEYGGSSITCLTCGLTSHNPNDVAARYCGRCHTFHDGEAAS